MPGSVERRKKCHSPSKSPGHIRKSSVQARRRYKRSLSRDCMLHAQSVGDLASRRKPVCYTSEGQHESKHCIREKPSNKVCTLFPLDVTDCLKNASDWEAMEIRILDEDKCTVLRPKVSDTQKSEKVIVQPSLYQNHHTVKGRSRSNQNSSRGSSVLKQTVCVEKVHVRNLLHTKREKCGNLGSSRSSEYMPSDTTTLAGTLTAAVESRDYIRISGSNTGLMSPGTHSESYSCQSTDTSDPETSPASILHSRLETPPSRMINRSLRVTCAQDRKQLEDICNSSECEDCTEDNDKDSEDEITGSSEDDDGDDGDDDDDELDEEEEGQDSEHGDDEGAESSVSDDSYYTKYYKEEECNNKLKSTCGINAEEKQEEPVSEDSADVSFVSQKSTFENQPAESHTPKKNIDLISSKSDRQNAVSKQTTPVSRQTDCHDGTKHSKPYSRDWSVTRTENQRSNVPFYTENEERSSWAQQGEPALNLNEPSTSLSVSEGKKWDTVPHSHDCSQSVSTATSTTARKTSFFPMPEEEIARYKQIALQILTERKQRALEDSQHSNVQPAQPHSAVEVQSRQVVKKKRNRPSRKYHRAARSKSKDAKASEVCQNTGCRASQRAGFWASWRIKNQIEKHRRRFHSADASASTMCRARNTHVVSTSRCNQKSPKQIALKERNSVSEHPGHFPGFAPVKLGFIKQRTVPHQYGKTQAKRQPSQILEALKPKHKNTVTGTKVWSASFKAQKPPTKTHSSSLFGNLHLTGKKSSCSIPSMMRSTQSHYYLKPSTNIHGGTARSSNMSAHPVQDAKQRTHYKHGAKCSQIGGKTNMKQPNRVCTTGQGKIYPTFGKEKQSEFDCGSILPERREKVTSQARDTLVTDEALQSGSLHKSIINAEAPIQSSFSIDNSQSTHENLPKQSSLPSLVDGEDESVNTSNVSSTANNEHEATSGEGFKESCKPRTYFDLLQNILKSPTAKAAQALGTFLQKPEAQETTERACDLTVDQIITSYQTLFDQLYDLSSKNVVNDKPKINENVMQSLECSHKSTDMKAPTNTKLQNTSITALMNVPESLQRNFKSAILENNVQSSSNNEEVCASNLSLDKGGERQALCFAGGADKNRSGGKSKENTKTIMRAADQETSSIPKNITVQEISNIPKNITVQETSNMAKNITVQETSNIPKNITVQAGIRNRASSSGGMFHFQGRSQCNHDFRHMWRSATSDKRSATDNRLILRQHEHMRSKSSHDSSETRKTISKQFEHTYRNPALEVRWNRTARVRSLENNTNHKMPVWSSRCKNSTKRASNKSATANAIKRISFSDSSCGIKPKINTFLKASFSCTRQPPVAAAAAATSTVFRMNAQESSVYKSKQSSQAKELPEKAPMDGKRKCSEQAVTKATHVGMINATGTSVQCMTTIQSNPESSNRLEKFLVHKECTSSIKAHALVTAQASARLMATDRTKLAVEGEPFIKDISNVARNPAGDSQKRELCAKNLQINGHYHQFQEHLNCKRSVKCSTESTGSTRAYPAITIFAPQACLNILTPKASAFSCDRTSGDKEGVKELQCVKNVSLINSQQRLQVTADSEVPNDGHIMHLDSNEDNKHEDKSVKETQDSAALQLINIPTQRRPIRSAFKSNSEQWTRRDETCTRKMQPEIPKGVCHEGQKQVHFRYGLSASRSIPTQVPYQRDTNALGLTQPCKKVGCTIPSGVFSEAHTESLKMLTKDKASVTICPSSPASRVAKAAEVSRNTKTCTSSANVETRSALSREESSRDTDTKIITKLNPRKVNGDQHVTIQNICAKKTKSEVGCAHEEQGCSKSKGTRAGRKSCLSWSKQHLTKSQEVKDKYFVNSTALRAIFVEPYPPFRRLADKHRCDMEANRRPLAWQKRRCRSAEGFGAKNATSRLFTYGKKKLPVERASPFGAGKPLKSDPHLRPSASNCALFQDKSRGKLVDPGQVKQADPKPEVFVDSKSISDISRKQHAGDTAGNFLHRTNTPDKSQGSTVNVSPSKQETKTYEKWGTPPWKPTISEDESELSDGSSLQAVRKHIVANTCRMIIRESRNLIVSNLQRPTREDSPQKATPAKTECDHELSQSQGGCLQTDMNQIINQAKESTNQAAVLQSHEISKVPAGGNSDKISDVSTETRANNHAPNPSVVSSQSSIEGSHRKLAVIKLHDSPIGLTGEPASDAPDNLCHIHLENANSSKPDMSPHNASASDVEFDEVKDFGSVINDMCGSSKRAIQGKQHQPAHEGIVAQVCQRCSDEDTSHDAEKDKQVLNNNIVIPVVKNIQENKQMQPVEQEVTIITTEDIDATHHNEIIDGCFQQDLNDIRDVASTFVSENEDVRVQEHNKKCEARENTNTDRKSRDTEQNSENSDQTRRGEQAVNIREQGSRAFYKEIENTYDVDTGKEYQDEEENVNHREHTSDEIWQNNHSQRHKDQSTEEHQKHACQTPEDNMQTKKGNHKKGTDEEYKARQNYQGNKDASPQNRHADTVNEDAKHNNRQVEHEHDGNDHQFDVLECEKGSAMQDTREKVKQSAFTRQENVDTWQRGRNVDEKNLNTWQRSRNVDEKNAYLLQRCRNTETRVGDMQQDNIRVKEQKNRFTDGITTENCDIEKSQRRKDIGSKTREETYNKNMEQEDKKQSRITENEGKDMWHECRNVGRDRSGTMQQIRSLERKRDISQTNEKVVHVRSESSQQSSGIDRDMAETVLGDTKIRRIKTQGRSVIYKYSDTGEESPDTMGNHTSAQQIGEEQERSRNGELTSGGKGVYMAIGEKTRKLAKISAETQHNKENNTRPEETDNGHSEKDETSDTHVADQMFEHTGMLPTFRNEGGELSDTCPEHRLTSNQQRNVDMDPKWEMHKENETYLKERVAKHEESGMFMGDTDKRHQQTDSRPDNRDQMHHASRDEKYNRGDLKGQCLPETEESFEQMLDGDKTEICRGKNINLQERDMYSGEKYTNLEDSFELCEQTHTEQEYATTDTQLQERDGQSDKTDQVFEETNKNYDTRGRKITERCAFEEPGDCADLVEEHNTEADAENINNVQESRDANKGSHVRHTRRQDCIIAEERPRTRYQNLEQSAHDRRNISGKYRRLSKESRESGQNTRGKAGKIGHSDEDRTAMRYPNRDTNIKYTNRKNSSVDYESKDSDLESSRDAFQDSRSAGEQDKHRLQRLRNQEHINNDSEQHMIESLQEGTAELFISKNINQQSRDTVHGNKHNKHETAFTAQTSQQKDKLECEGEVSEIEKVHAELGIKPRMCGKKTQKDEELHEMHQYLQHKTASVASTTQTEETCLTTLTSPRKSVQTRDQQTEIEDTFVLPAKKADRNVTGGTENDLQENQIFHKQESDIQLRSQQERLRGMQQPIQSLVYDISCLCYHPSEMFINMPLSPIAENTTVLVKTVSPTDSLSSTPGIKCLNPRKPFQSCEAVAKSPSHNDEAMVSHMNDVLDQPKGSTHEQKWNTDRGLLVGNEAKRTSKNMTTSIQKLPEGNCHIIALKYSPHSAMGHLEPSVAAGDTDGFVNKAVIETIPVDTSGWNLLPPFMQKTGSCCRFAVDLSTCPGESARISAIGIDHSDRLFHVEVDETMDAHTRQQHIKETDDTLKDRTYYQLKTEPNDEAINAYAHYRMRKGTNDEAICAHTHCGMSNEANYGTINTPTHIELGNELNDDTISAHTHHLMRKEANRGTINVHTHNQLRNEANDGTMAASTQHQHKNEPNEVEAQFLVTREQERLLISGHLYNVGDSSGTHGRTDLTVMCDSSIHFRPAHLCVDSLDDVLDTAFVHLNLESKDSGIFETTSIEQAAMQTKHTDIETYQAENFPSHSTTNPEINDPNDTFKCTMSTSCQNNPKDGKVETTDEPALPTPQSTLSTRHSLIVKLFQPGNLGNSHKSIPAVPAISLIACDNCDLYNRHLQQDLHSEVPYTPVDTCSPDDLNTRVSVATRSPCHLPDDPKPGMGNPLQSKLSAESITATQATARAVFRSNEKLPEHFQRRGPLFPDLPKNIQTAHTVHDSFQRMHSDCVSASCTQETFVQKNTKHSNEESSQTCRSTHKGTRAVSQHAEQTASSCPRPAKSQTIIPRVPRVCLLVARGGCVVQGERTRQIPAHVSFKDECPLGITSNYEQTKLMNSELEKHDENKTNHKMGEQSSIIENKRSDNIEEIKRSLKYGENFDARVNDTVGKPREECSYSERIATTQHAIVVPPTNSSNGVHTGDSNPFNTVRQIHANPSPCPLLQDTIAMRTRDEAWNKEYVIPHCLDDIKLRQRGNFLKHSFSGQNKDMTHWIDPEDKEASSGATSTRKTSQHNSSKSVQTDTTQESSAAAHNFAVSHTWYGNDEERAQLTAQRSLQTKLSHETSTQTLLKQSDFDDSLRLHQSIIIDKKGHITLLRDSCIGTSDIGTESDGHVVDAGTSKIDELVTLDESCSGVPLVTSTFGCLKSLCSPLSSASSKIEGIIRRVLTRSPDVKNTHIQQKAMENLELFVKSARERNVSASEPRTSPPCKPSTQSPASNCQVMSLQDFVITNPAQRAFSFKQSNVLDKENSLRDIKMHTDCSESIVTYSKPSTDNTQPSTNNDQMYNHVNKQTSPHTGANTPQKQAANIQFPINSASLPSSTSQSCLSASKLHFLGCTETISMMPATRTIDTASDLYQAVTQKALPGDHSVMHIPCRPNATLSIFSSQDGNLGPSIMEPPRSTNLPVADNEIFKATEDLARIHNAHNETTGPSLMYTASGTANTASNNTEKSQSASFPRSCTNPFLQNSTNPFMPTAPLHRVPSSEIEPQLLDIQRQPAPPLTSRPNLLLDTKAKQLAFDGGKSVEDWARSGSNRQDSLASSSYLFKDNTNKPHLSAIAEFISPGTVVSENRFENLHHDSKPKTPGKSCWRYVKGEDDLMLFSDASRDADGIKPGETCPVDNELIAESSCHLILLFNKEDPCLATRDEHLCEMPEPDRDDNNRDKGGNRVMALIGPEARKGRQINPNSRNNVEFKKPAIFQKNLVFFTEQSRQVGSSAGNSDALESGNKTSAYSVNNSISENLTSHCLLLKTINGLQASSASCLVNDSSEETLGDEVIDVSSSSPSLHSRISEDHSEDGVRCNLSMSHSCCQTQVSDQAANLNILETVTTLTSKFVDIFNGLKKNFHKSEGRHSKKHTASNLGRHRHYCYPPISKSAYPYRKSRNETKKSYGTSQQQIGTCHQEGDIRIVLPKKHSDVHNQKAYNLHKYLGKHQSSAAKKYSSLKSSNTGRTCAQSDLSTSISSQQKVHFRRRKKRTGKTSDEVCMSPHVYTEYRRLPVCSSNSESLQLRAGSSATNTVNEIRSNINQTSVSDVNTFSFPTVEAAVDTELTKGLEAAVDTETTKDHIVTHQGMVHASDTLSPDNYHSYPHVFLPQYPQLYVSVHNGGCYVMPNMPFLSTVFTILDDSYEAYLPDQQKKAPKLVLVDDEVNDQATEGGHVKADSSAAAVLLTNERQGTHFFPTTEGHQHKSYSHDTVTKHTIKLDQREPKGRAQSASEHSINEYLGDFKQPCTCNYVRYVDVVPLLPNTAISKDICAKQAGTCEVLGEIVHLAEDLDNSWKEAHLNKPFGNYRNEPKIDRYDTAVGVKSTNYSEVSSSNLEYDVARFSASRFPSLHGHYFIKEDLSSPPKRRNCDHPNRTPGPAGVSVSKQLPATGRQVSRDYYYPLGLEKGLNNLPYTTDVPIPSMTFENRFQSYRKESAPYLYHDSTSTHPKFLTKLKDNPLIDGAASITYSYRGGQEYFSHIFRGGSPLSSSSTDYSEDRESSTEIEVKAKTKDEKQYTLDDCEPDTYDELGSLCSEMQDTTWKLYQGDVEFGTCKDQTCSYESKSLSLGPTFEAIMGKELAASPHTISNMATQTIPQVKRCTSCSHYFGATLECSKKKAAKTRLISENQICQLSAEHVTKFPIQRYLLPVGQDYQLPPEYLEDSDYKNQAAPIWNMGLIALRSAPVTRSCFTQTDRPVPGQESYRPNMVEIRDLMGRCIKSRHFRYYVQHIVDERVRTTLRQNIFCNNDCKRVEKTKTVSPQKRKKKRQRLLNQACADVNPSVRHTAIQASLPNYIFQEVTNQDAPNTPTAKSLLARKASSNGSISVKPGLEESHNQGHMKFQWPRGIEDCKSYRTSDHFRTNNKQLANNMQSENALPEETNVFLENSKKPSSVDSRQASYDNTTNGIVSRSFPALATSSRVGPKDKVIKLCNSAVPAASVQQHRFCGSALPQINKETTEHLTNLTTVRHYSSVRISEVGIQSPVARTAKAATDINTCDKITAEIVHEFENIHLQDQKGTNSQLDTLAVGADLTNNTRLEASTLTDNTAQRRHSQSRYSSRSICQLYEPARTRLASTNCTCSTTRDIDAQEMSDVSSSSSTNIDYGRLGNIMSAETKLLWKNLTRLEKSYDRCKRCRKQYESILLSNKISGDCEAKTEKLDTACELHSEDLNATRCSNQSTEMADDCAKEKRTSKNEDNVAANTERPAEQSQETCVTDQYTNQGFNEINTSAALKISNSRRAEHTRASCLSPIKDSASKFEDMLNTTAVLKDDTVKKPWHVKGKNTAKMIQIFERGKGFFQDNEQARSRNDNHKAHECSDNELGHVNTSSNQQTHTRLKHTESKRTGNVFLTRTKKLKSTAFDDEAKRNCQERAKVSHDSINNIEKAQTAPSNTKCVPVEKLSSDVWDLANQHTLASTTSITDAQYILAMNAPNSESDEWIQKLVNILHEMQQTFPQMAATSANSAVSQGQSVQTQELAHLSEEPQISLMQGVGGKIKEMQEANPDVSHKSDLKWQRETSVGTWSIDHPTEIFEQDHSQVASTSCFPSRIKSNDATADLQTREFQAKKTEQHAQCKDIKPSNLGTTEETSEMVTQNPTQESVTTNRVKTLERSQLKHTHFSLLLKSADITPCLMSNTGRHSQPASPNNCMDENNQASGSLLLAEQFCCVSGHVYDMMVADGQKLESAKLISDEPIYASVHYLGSSSSYSYRDSCHRTPLLEQDISMCSDRKAASNTTLSMKTVDIVRKAHSCTGMSNLSRLSDWSQNQCNICYSQLNTSDSESQTQTLFEYLRPAHDARCINRSQPGKSPGVTNITQDVFMMSSGQKSELPESHLSDTRNEEIQIHWPKSEWREVINRPRNITLQASGSNQSQSSAVRDIASIYGAGLHSNSRSPDCNVHKTFKDSYNNMASTQSQTEVLHSHNEMDHCITQQDSQTILRDFSQGSRWKQEVPDELSWESEQYVPNTHRTKWNISSKTQRYNMLEPPSTKTIQSNGGHTWRHTSRMTSVLSEEMPGFGESYELTMATLNDIKDTSLFSNDADFGDDVEMPFVTEHNIQTDVIDTYSVQNNKSHSDNASTLHSVSGFGIPRVPTKETRDSSGLVGNKCLTENRTVDKSFLSWKDPDRKYNFHKKGAIDSSTYNISAKRLYSRSKRHKSVSPPSASLKEYISKESDTVAKDGSSCLQGTKTMSAKLDSRNQQTIHLQPFDIPIDIYTVPVHRCTSPQKKRKKKGDIPTRTVVISGPVRNMSIAVQRHMRSFDQGDVTNRLTPTHITSPDLADGSSATDRTNPEQITVSAYDKKSVPNWRHAMKRMLPFGKRTTSNEKKMHTDLVT